MPYVWPFPLSNVCLHLYEGDLTAKRNQYDRPLTPSPSSQHWERPKNNVVIIRQNTVFSPPPSPKENKRKQNGSLDVILIICSHPVSLMLATDNSNLVNWFLIFRPPLTELVSSQFLWYGLCWFWTSDVLSVGGQESAQGEIGQKETLSGGEAVMQVEFQLVFFSLVNKGVRRRGGEDHFIKFKVLGCEKNNLRQLVKA